MRKLLCIVFGHPMDYNHRGRPECKRCGFLPRYATMQEYEHAHRFIRGR